MPIIPKVRRVHELVAATIQLHFMEV